MYQRPFFCPPKILFLFEIIFVEMNKMKFNSGVFKILRNKYVIASLLFLTWIIFFDENSIVSHQKNKRRLYELKQQEEYYRARIEADKEKLEDLKAGEEKLEKFAREQYYMSKPGEDVFVVVDHD
ncbi:MAG: septum formation [Prolixibacteraceae bacterium]|nr:MAG: septum formation [Prolixibacteraceae bacterium]